MNLKKIFIISILLLSIFLIYLTTMDKKVYFLALGDSIALGDKQTSYPKLVTKYLEKKDLLEESRLEFIQDDLRITDLIRDIEYNKKIIIDGKGKTIKNALIKADLVTLSIGNEELFYKLKTEKEGDLYNYIDEMMEDMDKLLKLMKEYCKEDIFVLGYFNSFSKQMDKYIDYANQKLETLSKKYMMHYVDLQSLKSSSNKLEQGKQNQETIAQILFPLIKKTVILDE